VAASPPADSSENRLLTALPAEEYHRLLSDAEAVSLPLGQSLCEPGAAISDVYFVRAGVVSLLAVMRDGSTAEVATIGHEGMVGLPALLGAGASPARATVQIPGAAVRLGAVTFGEHACTDRALHGVLERYSQALLHQVAQSAACYRLHPLRQRCAHWLLMSHDRMQADRFPLTQEFLAKMLGVRRASVNGAAGGLQKAGLISYVRGKVTIADRPGLEAASCECYAIIRNEYVRLLG
jgi:CRP-like cAMP-binding protein